MAVACVSECVSVTVRVPPSSLLRSPSPPSSCACCILPLSNSSHLPRNHSTGLPRSRWRPMHASTGGVEDNRERVMGAGDDSVATVQGATGAVPRPAHSSLRCGQTRQVQSPPVLCLLPCARACVHTCRDRSCSLRVHVHVALPRTCMCTCTEDAQTYNHTHTSDVDGKGKRTRNVAGQLVARPPALATPRSEARPNQRPKSASSRMALRSASIS